MLNEHSVLYPEHIDHLKSAVLWSCGKMGIHPYEVPIRCDTYDICLETGLLREHFLEESNETLFSARNERIVLYIVICHDANTALDIAIDENLLVEIYDNFTIGFFCLEVTRSWLHGSDPR